ncbi:MAG: hypothetical protein R3F11_03815 [Verrucomicrobiales bacterium]
MIPGEVIGEGAQREEKFKIKRGDEEVEVGIGHPWISTHWRHVRVDGGIRQGDDHG